MNASNAYELAKRQIEIEFQAETEDARKRRQTKLDALEQLRSTLERVPANVPDAESVSDIVPENSKQNNDSAVSMSQRIKYEIASFDEGGHITMPEIYARMLAKYDDVPRMKPANVRSLIATLMKKLRDQQKLFLLIQGKSNEPNIYTRKPMLPLQQNEIFPGLAGEVAQTNGTFVLRDAVRAGIRGFQGRRFHFKDLLGVMRRDHPSEIDKKREASVSATVASLVNRGEIERAGMRNGKATYRAGDNSVLRDL